MSTDPKIQPRPTPDPQAGAPASKSRSERGILIFTYPKIIFMFPTVVAALICAIGMWVTGDKTDVHQVDAAQTTVETTKTKDAAAKPAAPTTTTTTKTTTDPAAAKHWTGRFGTPANLFGLLFLMTLFFNLVIVAIDFPRFTFVGIALLATTALFFLLWLGMYFNWLSALAGLLDGLFVAATGSFYMLCFVLLLAVYGIIFITRWLDYWEILPNEILHHHGPWSDLERFPTMNLKFDKEIPDIFEHIMFGAGRLILRVPSEAKSIVLDNVLHVSKKEMALKHLMSRLEVRVTTDNEVIQ